MGSPPKKQRLEVAQRENSGHVDRKDVFSSSGHMNRQNALSSLALRAKIEDARNPLQAASNILRSTVKARNVAATLSNMILEFQIIYDTYKFVGVVLNCLDSGGFMRVLTPHME